MASSCVTTTFVVMLAGCDLVLSRSDEKRLDDMREMCSAIARIVERGRSAFDTDFALPLALERALEVLGEAANHVSAEAESHTTRSPGARSHSFV